MTNKKSSTELFFNRDSIEFMYKRLTGELSDRTEDRDKYLGHMAELLDAPPSAGKMVLYATIQQVLSQVKDAEEVRDFLRTLMAYYEARENVRELELKVRALEAVLDPDGPLSLARVSFDDIPVYGEKKDEGIRST